MTSSTTTAIQPNLATLPLPLIPTAGFLRQRQVLALIPISKSTLWRRIQAQTFPAPLKLSERITVWRAEDIQLWMEQQACLSDVGLPGLGLMTK